MSGTEGRVRLTVLGGFLGSGKTTWLRHQLHEGRFGDALVIVNEAAETPVDDALLGRSRDLRVLAGGCACCTGRADLVALLRKVCDERSAAAAEDRLERIVLETSGLADPGPIVEAIQSDPVLVHHIVVGEVIVAADALHGLAQLRTEALGRKQVEIADRIVVTKVDEADPSGLPRLLATLRVLNPHAELSGAVRGEPAPLPPFDGAQAEPLPDAAGDGPPIFPTRLPLGDGADWAAFSVWLSALLHARGDDVLRVKGVVRTPAGRLLLQTVRRVVQAPEVLPEQPADGGREDDTIVVIGRGYEARQLRRSLDHFLGRSPSPGRQG